MTDTNLTSAAAQSTASSSETESWGALPQAPLPMPEQPLERQRAPLRLPFGLTLRRAGQ
ncbi:hypothetical protein [Mesobaculum littorinae]|uniref:hypothetical protein n=1 Tax=Mesobaculum littorinae TaxID=2486419 RepID=UPI0013E343C8|nr:hypothetical protein [Mesobaculum littorinae]